MRLIDADIFKEYVMKGFREEPEDDDYFIIGFKKATKIVKAGG